jgi:trans-aconitate methyltransferase
VTSPKTRPDIGFIPTPDDAIAAMLKLAELTSADLVYDLGCGDGRLLIQAALDYGVTAVGIDVDADLLATARTQAQAAGVGQQLQLYRDDLFECDVSDATVVFIYLLPHLNMRLRPRLLQQLQPGARIISHQFDMGNWSPDLTLRLEPSEEESVLHLWRIPEVISPELMTNK